MIIFSSERFHAAAYRWLPFFWIILAGTQGFGMLRVMGIHIGGSASATAGSPLERTLFLIMLVLALYLLSLRSDKVVLTMRSNLPLLLLFAYIAISISWSPLPAVSTKRFIKMVGALTIALMTVTENDPEQALHSLLSRYLWTVLIGSFITIIFIPEIGRVENYDGTISDAGICFTKNGLGQCAMASVLLAAVPLVCSGSRGMKRSDTAMFFMGLIVLAMSHSSTSMVVCVTVLAIMVMIKLFSAINHTHAASAAIFTVILGTTIFFLAEGMTPRFSIKDYVVESLGKDPTLTGRTELWNDVWKIASERPVLGYGTGSFWVGDIGVSKPIMESYDWPPNQAHNGYLDVIAELGFVGLALLAGFVLHSIYATARMLPFNFSYAMLRFALIFSVILLNMTESSFCRITHRVWMFMLLAAIVPPSYTPIHPTYTRDK